MRARTKRSFLLWSIKNVIAKMLGLAHGKKDPSKEKLVVFRVNKALTSWSLSAETHTEKSRRVVIAIFIMVALSVVVVEKDLCSGRSFFGNLFFL